MLIASSVRHSTMCCSEKWFMICRVLTLNILFLTKYLIILSVFDIPNLFYLSNTSFNRIRPAQQGCTRFIVVLSNGVTDVECHKRQLNFAVHDFSVIIH